MSDSFILLAVVGGIMVVILTGLTFLSTDGLSRRERGNFLQGVLAYFIFVFITLVGLSQPDRLLSIQFGFVLLLPLAILAGALGGGMIAQSMKGNRSAGIIAGMISGLSCLLIPYFYQQYRPKPSEPEILFIFFITLLPGGGLYAWMRNWKWLQPEPAGIGIQPGLERPIDPPPDQIPSQQLEFASDDKPAHEGWGIKNILINILIVALLGFDVIGLGIGTFLSIISFLGCKRVTLFSFFHNPSLDVLIGSLCLLVVWLVARRTGNPFSLYGFGTHFYGQTPTSNGYIATKWVTIAFFPLLPVRSYEIYWSKETPRYLMDIQATSYMMRPLKGLEMSQVTRVASIGYGALAGLGMLLWVMLQTAC